MVLFFWDVILAYQSETWALSPFGCQVRTFWPHFLTMAPGESWENVGLPSERDDDEEDPGRAAELEFRGEVRWHSFFRAET